MPSEDLNIQGITEARRKAIKKTIRPISIEEIKNLQDALFPYHDNAWRERFSEFIAENAGGSYYHATTHDRIEILYCHSKDKGIWYLAGSGLGPLQAKGLKIMKEIVEKT